MRCPYCTTDIADEALVCPGCSRELYLVKQLLGQIADLEARLAVAGATGVPVDPVVQEDGPLPGTADSEPWPARSWRQAVLACLLPIVLLLVAHWLIVFVYDAKVLYLRLLAMLLPLPCGLLFGRALRPHFGWSLLPAAAMAVAAVFAMSGLTGWLDKVPVMPQNMVEVREFIEFALSIGLSFTTGLWLEQWMRRRAEAQRLQAAERRRLGPLAMAHGQKLAESLSRLNDIGSAVVAFATTAISIYTGLKGVLGG